MIKTSISHPLRIDEVKAPTGGIIGMTLCPGKKIESTFSGVWERDLDIDLQAIREWDAQAIVNLMEDHEYELLQIPDYLEKVKAHPMEFYHLPIIDVNPPDERFAQRWVSVGPKLRQILLDGGKILIHCRGGLGRTGTVAAQLLVELGVPHEEAIKAVRDARPGAIENSKQEKYVYACKPLSGRLTEGHYKGCLLGGAVGDALGAAVEFDSIEAIRRKYGNSGIQNYVNVYDRKGAITDDTQMTLFTAEGLLRACCRQCHKGISAPFPAVTHNAYLRWLATQGAELPQKNIGIYRDGWLFAIKELHHRRAPGNTCLSALQSGNMGRLEKPINKSKGCGGVMRAAPIGLFGAKAGGFTTQKRRVTEIFKLGCEIAAITHGHPSGYLPAGCLAAIIADIIAGESIEVAIKHTLPILKKYKGHEETLAAINMALALKKDKAMKPCPETIEKMGGGWVGEEALAIALYCVLVAGNDFEKGICLAVNHSGDSDSTGSIAGNILGAILGKNAIPTRWLDDLELKEVIEEVAGDLFIFFEDTDSWWQKYPGY
ncbi:MAG TPA: ADP-ribosylglycohydrolase family protein [Smithellaceae bacterium]|jgi:ADP-ribosylglycohydrolase/protein-tyrosine phosphatase|nr:ADP-ribosylglycohydrolase family protein [Smithellaceae bacterium]HPM09137.1 ADP-ribosylglycohydrolase family protein [Paludibacter sp.]